MEGQSQLKETGKTIDTQSDDSRKTARYHVAVNMLCIIGATVGVAAVFMPWSGVSEGVWLSETSLADRVVNGTGDYFDFWLTAAAIFTAGTILAFAFPAAGIIQAVGLLFFYAYASDTVQTLSGHLTPYEFSLSIGFGFGLLSSIIVLAGLLVPIGPGCDVRTRWLTTRTDSVVRIRDNGKKKSAQRPGSPLDLFAMLAKERRWAAAWVAAALLLVPVVYATIPAAGDTEPVAGSAQGVAVSLPRVHTFWASYANITLSDGTDTVNWSLNFSDIVDFLPYSISWDKDCVTPIVLGERILSGLPLQATIIDWSGEGQISPGDLLILTPLRESSFGEGVPYEIVMMERVTALDAGYTDIYVDFEFAEGGIDSTIELVRGGYSLTMNHDYEDKLVSVALVLVLTIVLGAAYYLAVRPLLVRLQGRFE